MTSDEATKLFLKEATDNEKRLNAEKGKANNRGNVATIAPDLSAKADLNGKFYLIGAAGRNFAEGRIAPGPVDATTGHLGDEAYKRMLDALAQATKYQPGTSGHTSAVGKASNEVAGRLNELQNIKNPADAKQALKSEMSNTLQSGSNQITKQVAVESAAILRSLTGMSHVQEGAAIGAIYAMEQSLAAKGITVVAQKSVDLVGAAADKLADKPLATSLAQKAQIFADKSGLGKVLEDACSHLKSANISREAIKDFVGKHAGKLNILMEFSQHSDKLLVLAANSPSLVKLATNEEFREAAGKLTMGLGDAASAMPGAKGFSSVAIVTGSMMSGESMKDASAHLFRAACAVGGGVALGFGAGAAAGATTLGVGAAPAAIAGGIAGQELGSVFADFVLDKIGYEKSKEHQVSKEQLKEATKTLGNEAVAGIKDHVPGGNLENSLKEKVASIAPKDREGANSGHEMVRQFSKSS